MFCCWSSEEESTDFVVPQDTFLPPELITEDDDFFWMECNYGTVPESAVKAGRDSDGSPLYVGRAFHEGDIVPAKVAPSHGCAFVAWGGGEHTKTNYEVLCGGPGAWMLTSSGEIPEDAVHGGHTADGERLYIGRVMHEGSLTPGKVQPSHEVCYISYGGQELPFREFEILVSK